MDTMNPLVSVVVATRDRPPLLARCLSAIARQTYEHLEVIIVDDGSTDETRAQYPGLCPQLNGRITWLMPDRTGGPMTGPSAVRNRGVGAARGAYLAFCDDDDEWVADDHVAVGVRSLQAADGDFFFTDIASVRAGRRSSDDDWFPDRARLRSGAPLDGDVPVFQVALDTVLSVVAGRVIHPDTWVVRKSLIEEAGGFWEKLWGAEDYNLMMRVLDKATGILFRPDVCVEYRLAESGSQFLRSSPTEAILKEILASKHAQVSCRRPLVRAHARAREAWCLRRLARQAYRDGMRHESHVFFRQALGIHPTLGALVEYLLPGRRAGG